MCERASQLGRGGEFVRQGRCPGGHTSGGGGTCPGGVCPDTSYSYRKVPTPPGNSWIFLSKISRTWKVLENEFGPGKSWKSKFKVLQSPEIYLWFKLTSMLFMYITTCVNKSMKYSCYMLTQQLFATCDERFTMDCTITLCIYSK